MQETLLLIKPNAIKNKNAGEIITMVEKDGFNIEAIKIIQFDTELANQFYVEHIDKDFFPRLREFMMSSKVIAVKLSKEDAIARLRQLIGATDPAQRENGTIRALYADSYTQNAVHASDSEKSASREISIIFKVTSTG